MKMAEGEGFEPPVAFRLRLISSQVPSTTQPPFRSASNARNISHANAFAASGFDVSGSFRIKKFEPVSGSAEP